MDIKQLTEEMNRFVRSKGWYAENSKRPQTPRNLAISLGLEEAMLKKLEINKTQEWDTEESNVEHSKSRDI